jgi:hypothetical protein
MNTIIRSYPFLLVLVLLGLTACEPDFDKPRGLVIPEGNFLELGDLRQILQDSGTYKFTEDFSVYATVAADEASGNFFRNVWIQGDSTGVNMRLIEPGGLYIGDRIRINLKGAIVNEFAGVLQLDSVNVNTQVVIQSNNNPLQIFDTDLETLLTNPVEYQGRLVRLSNVEFVDGDIGTTYAISNNDNPEDPENVNKFIQDCDGNSIILRNSGYSSFADDIIPGAGGTLTAIMSQYNDDLQLYIRDTYDVDFTELRCDGSTGDYIFRDDFSGYGDGLSLNFSDDWETVQAVNASCDWLADEFFEKTTARASSFIGGSAQDADTWLITRELDLSGYTNVNMSFDNNKRYTGPDIQTLISTDYTTGSDPSAANWDLIQVSYDTDTDTWDLYNTGPIDISSYAGQTIHVAFRYIGSTGNTATWEIDTFSVYEGN